MSCLKIMYYFKVDGSTLSVDGPVDNKMFEPSMVGK